MENKNLIAEWVLTHSTSNQNEILNKLEKLSDETAKDFVAQMFDVESNTNQSTDADSEGSGEQDSIRKDDPMEFNLLEYANRIQTYPHTEYNIFEPVRVTNRNEVIEIVNAIRTRLDTLHDNELNSNHNRFQIGILLGALRILFKSAKAFYAFTETHMQLSESSCKFHKYYYELCKDYRKFLRVPGIFHQLKGQYKLMRHWFASEKCKNLNSEDPRSSDYWKSI